MIQNIALLATWSFPCFHVDHRRVLRGDGLSNRRYVPVTCARVNCANKTNPSIATSLARWSAPLVVRTRQQSGVSADLLPYISHQTKPRSQSLHLYARLRRRDGSNCNPPSSPVGPNYTLLSLSNRKCCSTAPKPNHVHASVSNQTSWELAYKRDSVSRPITRRIESDSLVAQLA